MARIGSALLDTDQRFPDLELQLTTGEKITLPSDSGEDFVVIFFYRGYW